MKISKSPCLYILSLIILFVSITASANLLNKQQTFLNVNQAFILNSIQYTKNTLKFDFNIAPNTYLYKHALKFSPVENNLQINNSTLPKGENKNDEFFGDVEIYHTRMQTNLSLNDAEPPFHIQVSYQGCATSGFCYPPQTRWIFIAKNGSASVLSQLNTYDTATINQTTTSNQSEYKKAESTIRNNPIWVVFGVFFVLGLLLAFTPCVLPMVPILSSIIVGHKENLSVIKGITLSTSYVLGMSLSYAILGLAVGSLGTNLQTLLQVPWVIISFSLLFILLALSEFKIIPFNIFDAISNKISNLSRNFQGGHYIPVLIMGALAALIVSPCVTPALVGALAYISHTSDAASGAISLFALGLGMGAPLVLVGAFGAHVLPKCGMWMQQISYIFGTLLLAIAVWLLSRILLAEVTLAIWSLFLICIAIYLVKNKQSSKLNILSKGVGVFSFIYAIILLLSALTGGKDPLNPLKHLQFNRANISTYEDVSAIKAITVKSPLQLKNAIESSINTYSHSIVLEYYADWCATCHHIDRTILSQPEVKAKLNEVTFIRVNVTEANTATQDLMKQFDVFAPPVFIFMDNKGKEKSDLRLVGEISKEELMYSLRNAQL